MNRPILMTTRLANGAKCMRRRNLLELGTPQVSSENRFQLVRRNDFKLRVGAIARVLVGPPLPELRHMAESRALHMLVCNFDYQLGPERLPRQILAVAPTALTSRHPMRCVT